MDNFDNIPVFGEYEPHDLKYAMKNTLSRDEYCPQAHYNKKPIILYDLINILPKSFSFTHENFDDKDIKQYFKMQNKLSQSTILDLIEKSDYSDHFRIINRNRKLKNLLKECYPEINIVNDISFIEFALYTDKKQADRSNKIKSPRIFALLGNHGAFHILFYDPYHEIFPKKSEY